MPYFLVTNSCDCDLLRGLYISSAASGVTYILSRGKLNSLAMSFLENSETVIIPLQLSKILGSSYCFRHS